MTDDDGELGLGLNDDFNLTDELEIATVAAGKERSERLTALIRARKVAYGRVFVDGNSTADDRKIVMDDLKNFCREDRSTYTADPRKSDFLAGRREVILRVNDHIERSVDELYAMLA